MLNTVQLMGRLVSDPELKSTNSGIDVSSFTLAVNQDIKDKPANFIDCVAWKGTAVFVERYFRKGQLMVCKGRLQTRMYEDKEGKPRKATEVIVEAVYFAEKKKEDNTPAQSQSLYDEPSNSGLNDFEEIDTYSPEELPF